ncbi:Uncharacterised protein [Mycobacterium tuberculosis]|nr:Uncharacterised protein [Mycobacterium tuberculosis]
MLQLLGANPVRSRPKAAFQPVRLLHELLLQGFQPFLLRGQLPGFRFQSIIPLSLSPALGQLRFRCIQLLQGAVNQRRPAARPIQLLLLLCKLPLRCAKLRSAGAEPRAVHKAADLIALQRPQLLQLRQAKRKQAAKQLRRNPAEQCRQLRFPAYGPVREHHADAARCRRSSPAALRAVPPLYTNAPALLVPKRNRTALAASLPRGVAVRRSSCSKAEQHGTDEIHDRAFARFIGPVQKRYGARKC